MPNKEGYFLHFESVLFEYYTVLKDAGVIPRDLKHYLDGYMVAGRASNIASNKELDLAIEKVHYQIFGITSDQRRAAESHPPKLSNDYYDVPAYRRKNRQVKF